MDETHHSYIMGDGSIKVREGTAKITEDSSQQSYQTIYEKKTNDIN